VDSRLDVYAEPQRLVRDAGRRRLNVLDDGEGSPTVVLVAGMGGTTISWARVQRRLAATNRVVSFDRAGHGFSDRARLPRTAGDHLADLRAALAAIGAQAPYVVVGHSAGSFEARLFAARHRDEVCGLVLVDPSTEHQGARFAEVVPAVDAAYADASARYRRCEGCARRGALPDDCIDVVPGLPPAVAAAERAWLDLPTSWRTRRVELEVFAAASADEVAADCGDFGDVPMIVLTAGQGVAGVALTPDEQSALDATWFRMHDEMASRSTRGERRTVDTEHNIQLFRPDAVVDAVRDVVAAATAPASP
jgi:pimeloyl-ACP methyl ester carboxylesterase